MDLLPHLLLFGFTTLVGWLIGCTGIGGVLVVPYLTFVMDMTPHQAIASALFSYIFSGAAATFAYARRGSVRWPMVWAVCGAAAPAAFLGSLAASRVPGGVLLAGIAALILFAAWRALSGGAAAVEDEGTPIRLPVLAGVGAITGFLSAMVGAGGAIILIPLMFTIGAPALPTIGLSMAIQVPIALLSTAGNLAVGRIDYVAGLVMAAALVLGIEIGARLAHALPVDRLRRFVAWTLAVVGVLILAQLARDWAGL